MFGKVKQLLKDSFLFFCLILGIGSLTLLWILSKINIRLNPTIITIGILLLIFIVVVIIIVCLLTFTASSMLDKKGDAMPDKITLFGKNGIIQNIPANHVRVIRNNLNFKLFGFVRSTPGKIEWDETSKTMVETAWPMNYTKQPEGWSWYYPILQTNMGTVDISPDPVDPDIITVNTKDNQVVEVDWWGKIFVSDPTRYLTNIRTQKEKEDFQNKIVNAALEEICSKETQVDLTNFEKKKIKEKEDELIKMFNESAKPLGIQAASLDIKKFLPPKHVKDAAELVAIAEKRKEAATNIAEELRRKIAGTKVVVQERGPNGEVLKEKDVVANPTWIAVAERFGETVANLIGNGLNSINKKKGE